MIGGAFRKPVPKGFLLFEYSAKSGGIRFLEVGAGDRTLMFEAAVVQHAEGIRLVPELEFCASGQPLVEFNVRRCLIWQIYEALAVAHLNFELDRVGVVVAGIFSSVEGPIHPGRPNRDSIAPGRGNRWQGFQDEGIPRIIEVYILVRRPARRWPGPASFFDILGGNPIAFRLRLLA